MNLRHVGDALLKAHLLLEYTFFGVVIFKMPFDFAGQGKRDFALMLK